MVWWPLQHLGVMVVAGSRSCLECARKHQPSRYPDADPGAAALPCRHCNHPLSHIPTGCSSGPRCRSASSRFFLACSSLPTQSAALMHSGGRHKKQRPVASYSTFGRAWLVHWEDVHISWCQASPEGRAGDVSREFASLSTIVSCEIVLSDLIHEPLQMGVYSS